MKLSIITICLNNLRELQCTVESILSQTYQDYEYIIIDGDSIDGCKEYIAQTSRIDYWISEPDTGIYNAMNKGVQMAHGEYILFLNSGDKLYAKDVLEQVVPYLETGDFYVGHSLLYNNGRMVLRETPSKMSVKFLFKSSIMHQSTFIRSALLKKKPYNEKHKIVSDWEYFFEEWIFNNREYIPLDIIVSIFYLGGISNNEKSLMLNDQERQEVIDKWFPKRVQDAILGKDRYDFDEVDRLEKKIQKAMVLPPIQRDAKLLRNAFKYLLKDILHFRRMSSQKEQNWL